MRTLFLITFLFNSLFHCNAQNGALSGEALERLNDGRAVSTGTYRFPEFVNGTVYFRNKKSRMARLNYNYRHGLIEFIDLNQDTLVFTGKHLMDLVEIGPAIFHLSEENGDMEQIGRYDAVILAQKTRPELVGDKLPHSGQRFSATNTVQPSGLFIGTSGGGVQWQNNSLGESYKVRNSYYLIDGNRVFYEATKSNVMKIYGRHKAAVRGYLNDHKVDFKRAADLDRLLSFCASLAGRSADAAQ